ncbi:PQQ-dependent sugar dehydrogenase [Paraburkholderia sp. GAS41]|uniref:PQQ-dependent sugar dehydrogenase n=1 Tax=Paraburkholderia sp. GAS41 TaxID=3035134 RepID=UPI003D22A412
MLVSLGVCGEAAAQGTPESNAALGKTFFQQNCAMCHADSLGAGNLAIQRQGPSLVGVFGRRAGSQPNFNFTNALSGSGITWNSASLERFLANPVANVPGTAMPVSVADASDRSNVIAYLATLKLPAQISSDSRPASSAAPETDPGDWRRAAPGVEHHLTVADLPAPYKTTSSGNGPRVVTQPANASLSVPPGFKVQLFASRLSNPRIVRVAPNGDIFVAETCANRIRVLRAADGADTPSDNQIFAEGLDRPFGIAFYPSGSHPQWIYVANNNSVVRFPYRSGDLKASGAAQVVVPHLADSTGGHTTRDVAFSPDGKRMYITVGSGSNVAEGMGKKSPADIARWDAEHGQGAGWDAETNRADILVTDPEGHEPLHAFATGIRNGAGIAVDPDTGELWTATNERDGLGDDLVPDYVTRVKAGGFYGWPWFYLGGHEDPRHAGERPDLAARTLVPDVLLQSHSAPLELCFYTSTSGAAVFPAAYRGDVFVALHGSWNRSSRTGYKVVRVRLAHGVPTGEYEDFLTGFVADDRNVWGRPVGVAVAHDGALLVTEDGNGTLWRISYADRS